MIFQDKQSGQYKKSGLVKLSDSVKISINDCFEISGELIDIHKKHQDVFARINKKIDNSAEFAQILKAFDDKRELSDIEKLRLTSFETEIHEMSYQIPPDAVNAMSVLRAIRDQRAVSVILNCLFCIESYTKSFYYFYKDSLKNKVKNNRFNSMNIEERLNTIEPLILADEFNTRSLLALDLQALNHYRNDIVHDNISSFGDDRSQRRYYGQLPDPVLGFLNLSHIIFAADTYWKLVDEIHKLTGLSKEDFQKHYNLSPWFSSDFETKVRERAEQLNKIEVII